MGSNWDGNVNKNATNLVTEYSNFPAGRFSVVFFRKQNVKMSVLEFYEEREQQIINHFKLLVFHIHTLSCKI